MERKKEIWSLASYTVYIAPVIVGFSPRTINKNKVFLLYVAFDPGILLQQHKAVDTVWLYVVLKTSVLYN